MQLSSGEAFASGWQSHYLLLSLLLLAKTTAEVTSSIRGTLKPTIVLLSSDNFSGNLIYSEIRHFNIQRLSRAGLNKTL